MRFLIISPIRSEAYQRFYSEQPMLEHLPHEEQIQTIESDLNTAPWLYAKNLRLLGHDALMVAPSNELAQKVWAREHSIDINPDYRWRFRFRKGIVPWLSVVPDKEWYYKVLAAQIKRYKPDVLLNMAMAKIKPEFIQEMNAYVKYTMAQFGGFHPPENLDISCYDLVVSPCAPTVDLLLQKGVKAQLVSFGFERAILPELNNNEKSYDISFVGTIGQHGFEARTSWLEEICTRFPQFRIWGPSIEGLSPDSPIRKVYQGQAWGLKMFQIFRDSKIVFNIHSDYFSFAHNVRLFEITGTGSMLLTDRIPNLSKLFVPGKEVAAFQSLEECNRLIKYYLEHDSERESIAIAGQQRTLQDHSYFQRMQELLEIVQV